MTIRKLRKTEAHFLVDMLYEAIFVPEGHAPLPKEIVKDKSLSKYTENWGKDKFDIALVMMVDHVPVGAVWGRLLTKGNKGFGHVNDRTPELSMAVLDAYRNRGIGTKLIKAIASEYGKIGVDCLSLSVDKANKAAGLYRRLGYEIVEETDTSWTMKKELNDGL